jgi:nicotinate-nucleotide adenylyltransferase
MGGRVTRIGLLGGSFDPPHLAHLALARVALRDLALDELLWLPARAPWQKSGRPMAPAGHRLAMVAALIEGEPRFTIDDRECRRPGPSYTVDSVRELSAERPGTQWFLVVGQDQYARFDTWRDWRELLASTTLAVAGREGEPPRPPPAVAAVPHRLAVLNLPRLDISATRVRERLAAGAEIASLVGPAVASYIDSHALYAGRPRS